MQMKKIVAVVLAGTMILGSGCMTAWADAPTNSGTVDGAGTSEGSFLRVLEEPRIFYRGYYTTAPSPGQPV